MKFIALCFFLLLALIATLGSLPGAVAEPSRDSGGNSWRGGSSGTQPKQRPFIYDAPIRQPGRPQTRYA
ncbi:PREDICTED: immune-induced peptide 18 [Drosophila arizonae]|uniref:Immune-induced peptide 18 n=1 Tax=Drosophila arizonae TaxID=7263 RepID=A0ABM1PC63_DROAR|nr:PREDICTED: immune-induced peptide 18 [Drosophila arizonae]